MVRVRASFAPECFFILGILTFLWLGGSMPLHAAKPAHPEIIAYVFPNLPGDRPLVPSDIPAEQLTRVNYAFALIQDGKVVESGSEDTANLAMLGKLRQAHPSLKLLVSVGGWLGSGGFSDAVLTPESRTRFVESALAFIDRYGLDGLDLDWEYPGLPGAGNAHRPSDGDHFVLLLRQLHETFRNGSHRGKPLLLTIAAGASLPYLEHMPMARAHPFLDTVNLMTYDFYEAGEKPSLTGNHAPLFADPADPQKASSAAMVEAFRKAGVPAEKIVLGVPFYGRAWTGVPPAHHGLFQPGIADPALHGSYIDIAPLLTRGFTRYWDAASQVPYLYNSVTGQFLSYEDPESLRAKCAYLRAQHLGGIMFWQLFSDPSGQLLGAIHNSLYPAQNAPENPHR